MRKHNHLYVLFFASTLFVEEIPCLVEAAFRYLGVKLIFGTGMFAAFVGHRFVTHPEHEVFVHHKKRFFNLVLRKEERQNFGD